MSVLQRVRLLVAHLLMTGALSFVVKIFTNGSCGPEKACLFQQRMCNDIICNISTVCSGTKSASFKGGGGGGGIAFISMTIAVVMVHPYGMLARQFPA